MNPVHPYIVTGPKASPVILTVDPKVSLSYLARCIWANDEESVELTQRTFGCEYHYAWPAWEHDVIVRLVQQYAGIHSEQVIGLAAAVLSRSAIPTSSVPNPFAELLQPRTSAPALEPQKPKRAPRAPQPQKPSALQQLMGAK